MALGIPPSATTSSSVNKRIYKYKNYFFLRYTSILTDTYIHKIIIINNLKHQIASSFINILVESSSCEDSWT